MALSCSKKNISIIKRNNLKYNGDFYCLNYLHFFRTKNKLESQKKLCENKDFCDDKAPFIIYADLECIIQKIDGFKNNPENSSTKEVSKHIPSGFSMSTISSFKSIENKHGVYRGKDCMKKFCEFLREHAMKTISFKKKKMKLLTTSSKTNMKMQKSVVIVKKNLKINM